MNRSILVFALVAATSTLFAQQSSQSGQYQGTSNPPPDDTIITDTDQAPPTPAKPSAAHPLTAPSAVTTAPQPAMSAATPATASNTAVQQSASTLPSDLTTGPMASDPDGDIVHPAPLGPGDTRLRLQGGGLTCASSAGS